MKEFNLKNNIKAVSKQNKNTPRIALSLNFTINEAEDIAGTYCLVSRLLLQGTKTRSSEQLSQELEENAIEFSCDMKQDYLRFRFVCLNEDFERAVELTADIIKNSTFEEFDKEKEKMNGEITAELDSAKTKALDNFYRNLYDGHFYGHTYTKILEAIDKITKADVENTYKSIVSTSKKVLSVVGDINSKDAQVVLDKYLGDVENSNPQEKSIKTPALNESKKVEIIKNDVQQAQIIQGWIFPTFDANDYPAIVLLNVILGAAGLSSRLFLELRDKKGLAYTVRSSYETYKTCATFSIYIATEPKNIEISLDGFKEEIDKFKQFPVDDIELNFAKNNVIGKQQFVTETNSQQANLLAYYGVMELGFDYQAKIIEKIKQVNAQQIQDCANKYFTENSVISVLKP